MRTEDATCGESPRPTVRLAHCEAVATRYVIDKSVHRRMKLLSLKRGISLRQIVNEAMTEYLGRNGK